MVKQEKQIEEVEEIKLDGTLSDFESYPKKLKEFLDKKDVSNLVFRFKRK